MKKFYHIYQVIDGEIIDGITYPTSEEFKEKAFSEHSAVEWI